MTVAEKAAALLEGLSKRDLLTMPAEQRRRFAAALRRIADLADPPAFKAPPKTGVLLDLHRGERAL
jgi:phage-related protein